MYLRSVDAVLSGAVLAGCLRSGRSSPTPVSSCCSSCLSDQVDHQDPVMGQARYRLSNFVNGHFAVPETHNRVLDQVVFVPPFSKNSKKDFWQKRRQLWISRKKLNIFDKNLQNSFKSLWIFIHFEEFSKNLSNFWGKQRIFQNI